MSGGALLKKVSVLVEDPKAGALGLTLFICKKNAEGNLYYINLLLQMTSSEST